MGFVSTKRQALFFADSAAYFLERIPSYWRDNKDFERDIVKIQVEETPKFRQVTDNTVILQIGNIVSDSYVNVWKEFKCRNVEDYADTVGVIAEKSADRYPFTAYIFTFDKVRREILAYWVSVRISYKAEEIPLPSYMIASATHEPKEILEDFFGFEKLVEGYGRNRIVAAESLWNQVIKNIMLKGNLVFEEIARQFSTYKKPWRMGLLNENGLKNLAP
jgi:hypothetical protein